MSEKHRGVVKWYNDKKRFGFITAHDGEDIFVHHTDAEGLKLDQGVAVEFEIGQAPKGKKAINIVVLDVH